MNCETCKYLQIVSYENPPCRDCVGSKWEPDEVV